MADKTGESQRRVYQNSLYYSCIFSIDLQFFQNKKINKYLRKGVACKHKLLRIES